MFRQIQSALMVSLIGSSVLLLIGCGSRIPIEGAARGGSHDRDPGSADATSSSRCPAVNLPSSLSEKGFQSLSLSRYWLATPDGYRKNLCDTLKDSENTVLIMQFSGVTCGSCQEEAVFFTSSLNLKAKFGNRIGHAVALTDLPDDYVEADYVSFMTRHAPQSIRLHDENIRLWTAFSANPQAPERPTIIAYNASGWAFVVNRDRGGAVANGTAVLAAAEVLAAIKNSEVLPDGTPDTIGNSDDSTGDGDGNGEPGNMDPATPVNPIFPAPPISPSPLPSPLPSPTPGVTPQPVPTPTVAPTPPPGPVKNPVQITAAKNFSLSGGATGENLATYFGDNDYLVIDISQVNCSPCIRMAQAQNTDAKFKEEMTGGKCKNLTVVSDRELSAWNQKFPTATFVGGRSRGVSSITSFGTAWGFGSLATPTVFVIDRSGNKVASAVGSEPAEVERLCKK